MITWSIVFVVIMAAFGGTVLVLNASLYSASGFVRGYLDSLARHDAEGALKLSGPATAGAASAELLVPKAMADITEIALLSDSVDEQGVHAVTYSYSAGGVAGKSTFHVLQRGILLGVFTTWKFQTSPLGVIQLTVQHDSGFAANGLALRSPTPNQAAAYRVFTPGFYEFSHHSTWLQAQTVPVASTVPAGAVPAQLDIEANAAFGKQVHKQVNAYLDECATQTLLLPTGCPFGEPMSNRIVSTPAWKMSHYPSVVILPGASAGEWMMPSSTAAARLVVDVKSLFDGSISTFNEDVPFTASFRITVLPNGELSIAAQ